MIARDADIANYRYLRGRALERLDRPREALADYAATVSLAGNVADVSSAVFRSMAAMDAAIGHYCEAITPIQTWIAGDPTTRDTPQTRTLIATYAEKGHCEAIYANGEDRFPVVSRNVIRAKVEINGVTGEFIVDTGASDVVLTEEFAQRAHVSVDKASLTKAHTANGVVEGRMTTAASVRLGRVGAADVETVVQKPTLGPHIDGLLGRSFLARFDVTFSDKEWTVRGKKSLALREATQL